MRIVQIQFYVLICCGAAVSDLVTDLGSDVIINCDLEDDVYWIFLKTPDPPTVILRSFPTSTPHYFNKTFRKKYSVQFKHCLVINNVTADELGVYYCMNTSGTPPKLSNSTRINIRGQTQRNEGQNQTVVQCIECNNTIPKTEPNENQWPIIIIISGVTNGILLIVVIGLVKVFVVGNECSRHSTDLQQTQVIEQDQDQLQYATMDFTNMRRKMRSSQINSTYAALKLPQS